MHNLLSPIEHLVLNSKYVYSVWKSCLDVFHCYLASLMMLLLQHYNCDDIACSIVILWGQSAEVSLGGALWQTSCWFSAVFGRSSDPNVPWSWSWWRTKLSWSALPQENHFPMRIMNALLLWSFWFWALPLLLLAIQRFDQHGLVNSGWKLDLQI